MLNHEKLIREFEKHSSLLFPDNSGKKTTAKKIWNEIVQDPMFSQRSAVAQSSFLVPGWTGNLDDSFKINYENLSEYTVLAIDGSQIYPDRNMPGNSCFLINIGGILLTYGKQSSVNFFSEPKILLPEHLIRENISFSKDLIDLKREEFELEQSFKIALEKGFNKKNIPKVCLIDGSLIFWQLDSKTPEVKNLFLNSYLKYLNDFYENKILVAGYISFPKSKELVNLIKLGLCRYKIADCIGCHKEHDFFPCREVDNLLDTQITKFFLKPFHRTTTFWSTSKIIKSYPTHLKPYFFYLDVGEEIVRIEIPAWIAENPDYLETICKISIDQALKGKGYPITLAEAHEFAVVKGPDRNFFFNLVFKSGISQNKRLLVSQKSIKKLGLSV
ncbi:DNA double-strand break repair nuclease NurA [Candidatus Babeliales bacterium]|nr:DNA double-strand break repair nuclease NurA [Candidatus Babeliales bacterium]